jgi:hypothetical protein
MTRGFMALACDARLVMPICLVARGSATERVAVALRTLAPPHVVDATLRADINLQTPARLLYATPRRFVAQPELGGQTWN